jgi:hypothetical protein
MKKFYLNSQQYMSKTVISFWTVFLVFVFGNSIIAQNTTITVTTTGSNSWTVPCGVTSITVEAWGAGGAGGAATINPSGGSGGGGGGYSTDFIAVSPGQIINYSVGSKGMGGTGAGGNGAPTTIEGLTANGGSGGLQNNGTVGSGGTAAGGSTNTTGTSGSLGSDTSGAAGGAGANGGAGGTTVTITSIGTNGTGPGGGGGGGLLLTAGTSNGGNGADGQISITYITPTALAAPTSITPSSGIGVCNGSSTNLNATSSGNTINWYTVPSGGTSIGSSASGANFSVSPTINTTYYAEAQSSPGCVSTSRTATGLVTVNALPVITVQPTAPTACAGIGSKTITVTATGTSLTYQWMKGISPPTALTVTPPYSTVTIATLTITAPPLSEDGASLSVVVTNGQGCKVTSNVVILKVVPLPSPPTLVTPSSPVGICSGASINLNGTSAGNTIFWFTAPSGGSSSGNSPSGANFSVTPASTTTYYGETRTPAPGSCPSTTRTATALITVSTLPVITVQPVAPATVCAGAGTATISVTATGVSSYQWRRNGVDLTNTPPFSNVTTATLTITNPAFTENGAAFSVMLNGNACPLLSSAVALTVQDLPAPPTPVTPSSNVDICSSTTSTNLNATSAGNTIYWYTVATGGTNIGTSASAANFSVSPVIPTIYYAEARSTIGCISPTRTATGSVKVSTLPVISTQPVAPATVCAGAGTVTMSVTATGVSTYQWRRNGLDLTNTPPFSNVTTATLTITNPAFIENGASFSVMLNDATCPVISNAVTLTVQDTPAPPSPVTPSSAVVICSASTNTNLNATSAGNTIYWYTVATGGTNIGTSASAANFLVSPATPTIYYAEARSAAGCISPTRTATGSVTVNTLPVITAQPVTPAVACAGTGIVTISVTATGVSTYQWRRNGVNLSNGAPYSGVNTATLTITNPPIGDNAIPFDVILNSATCLVTSNPVTLTVNASPSPPTSVTPSSPISFCGGVGSVTLNATSTGNTIYWYTVATGGTSIGNSPSGSGLSVTPASTTTYYAEARNAAGCNSPTRTATATVTVAATPVLTIEFTERSNDKTYSIATCGHIAASENDIDIRSGNPNGDYTSTFGSTATGQWQVSYDNQATWVNAPGPTSTAPQYLFDPAYTIYESTPGTYYFRLILTVNGCPGTSDVITLTVNGDPTLSSGSVAGDQSSCATSYNPALFTQTAAATVGIPISGYNFSYQWQSSTDNINFTSIASATATTYDAPSISVTTYYRRIAIYGSAGGGCSAASNTITVMVGSLAPPTIGAITQPNCTSATGSVALSGLPASGTWTLTRSGTSSATSSGTGASTTISGLAAGTYTFTVTATGCASASAPSANVIINVQPTVPTTPTAGTITQPTCVLATGSVVINNLPAGTWTLTRSGTSSTTINSSGATTTITGLAAGTYNFTVTNSVGCTSPALTNIVINAQPTTPTAPIVGTITQPTCAIATGSVVLSGLPASGTWTLNPGAITGTGTSTTRSGLAVGTYNFTVTNAGGCTSVASANVVINAQPAPPAVPTISSTAASCSAEGTSTVSNYLAAYTYTFTPTGPTVGGSGLIGSMILGTSYTVTASSGGCTSATSASFSNAAQLPTPAVPTISSTAANCSAEGTGTVSNYLAANTYTFTPTGPTVGGSGLIGSMVLGTSYTVTASSGGCTSAASASFSNAAQLPTPAVPSLSAGTINCNAFTADWTPSANVTGYRIDVATDAGFTSILAAYNNLLLGSTLVSTNVNGLASGLTFYIRVRAENSCGTSANSATLTITTGASTTAFTTTSVQPNCILATGTITVTESIVDPADQYSFDDGVTYQSSNMKDLLAAGTYKIKIKNTGGCETLTQTVVLNPAVTTTYSGTWSNGTPDILKRVIFASNFTISADLTACSCQVNTGINVTVNSGFSLLLENGLDVLGTGLITFNNNSSLIQTNDVANTGNITYMRNTTAIGKFDFTYWSSPVYPQTLFDVSPTTLFDKYYSWDAVADTWKIESNGSAVMERGVGYIIRGPQGNLTPAVYTASFIGVPNNGPISYPIAGAGLSYLIGNPYPSALDADKFLVANPALDGTIYFWTHNTPITNYVYNHDDYASYNGVGGTATAAALNPGINNAVPSGKIASGQSFFATTNATGNVTFENTMRVSTTGAILDNSQFFKGTKTKTSSALKKHRVWLNLSNTEGAFKQLLVGYVTSATNGLDKRFDGVTLDANTYLDFYSINDNKKLSIQGRALPYDLTDQVPLGYRTTVQGTFTINIDQIDGVLANLPVFLEDKSTGVVVNLKKGDYSFSTAIGTFDDRFVLRYIDKSIKISDFTTIHFDAINENVIVSVKNNTVKITSFDQTIDKVILYDLRRRKLYEKDNINSNEFSIPEFSLTNQILIVQIRLKNGKWVRDKIVF